jgi:C4-dicarboxylate transporter, DctM subunit
MSLDILLTLAICGIALILLFLGVHIGLALAITGAIGIVLVTGTIQAGLGVLKTSPFFTGSGYTFAVLPMFILMGLFTLHGGISGQAYEAVYKLIGKLPGSLSIATTWACVAFGATSGSTIAAATLFTKVGWPEMKKNGYDANFACGGIATSAIIAMLVPPSIYLVIYAMLTEMSVSRLLMAGFIPGIVMALVLSLGVLLLAFRNPRLAPGLTTSPSRKEKLIAIGKSWPFMLLALIIIVGIYSGVFTATEAAAVAAFTSLIICLGYRRLTWNKLISSLVETVQITAMMLLILVGATVFATFLSVSGLTTALGNSIIGLNLPPLMFMIILMLLYILLGCFMDEVSSMCITLPIFFPIIEIMGIDPIWSAIILVAAMTTGMITPPFGISVFAVQAASGNDATAGGIFRGSLPYYVMILITLVILVAFPQISTFLPNTMMGS